MQRTEQQHTIVKRVTYGALFVATLCTASLLIMTVTWLHDMPLGSFLVVPYVLFAVGVVSVVIAYRLYGAAHHIAALSVSIMVAVVMAWCISVIYYSDDSAPWLRTLSAYRAAQWNTISPIDRLPQDYFLFKDIIAPEGFREVRRYDSRTGAVRVYEEHDAGAGITIIVVETPKRDNDDALMTYPLYTLRWDDVRGGIRSIIYRNHDLERNDAQRDTYYAHVHGTQTLVSVYFCNVPENGISYHTMETILRDIVQPTTRPVL